MRISTATFQNDAVSQMQTLQSDLAVIQSQLASSKKVQSAADDPSGMAQVNLLNSEISASKQYVTNGNAATANLSLEAQAMTDATNLLQSARDLAVEANNPALSAAQRGDIATQLQQQLQDLVSIGNRTDSNGNYLFAGNAASTQPFNSTNSTVSYSGSDSVSQVQIAANQRISGGDTGATVFMNVPAGNGTFTTSAGAANTGSASIGVGTVTNAASWVPDNYTITFNSATSYFVTNGAGNSVATGSNFSPGDSIAFNGVQTVISGAPSPGDTFTVAPAGNASAFSTLQSLVTTLSDPNLTSAQIATQVGGALQQIDNAITNLGDVQASTGARLNSITSAGTTAQVVQTNLTTAAGSITDVDYAAALTQLNSEELSLQAAQQSYASIAQLSLFKYLQG